MKIGLILVDIQKDIFPVVRKNSSPVHKEQDNSLLHHAGKQNPGGFLS
jgi:hypothetical protein